MLALLDLEIQKFTRRCARLDRELKAGESFYSELVQASGQVVRRDYAAEAWQGPTPETIGWWKSEVPDPRANRMQWAPSDVMLDYFTQLLEDGHKAEACYVLALLMIRRRIFRLEASETHADGQETLLIYCPRNETEYRVPVATPTEVQADRKSVV